MGGGVEPREHHDNPTLPSKQLGSSNRNPLCCKLVYTTNAGSCQRISGFNYGYSWYEITPLLGVITPATHLFSAIYKRYKVVTPFISSFSGPTLHVTGIVESIAICHKSVYGRFQK